MSRINWDGVIGCIGLDNLISFSVGQLSRKRVEKGELGQALRSRGVMDTRKIARKALRRRGVNINY